jgi:uncharacterized oxidoreductase
MILFDHLSLLEFATDVFVACGSPEPEARIVADHLVSANLMGYDTHGIMRIPQYVEEVRGGMICPGAPVSLVDETGSTCIVDAGWNFGQVGGLRAIDVAVEKARRVHSSTVVVRRCNHAGRLGTFTQRAAEAGFIAIGFCNSPIHGHFVLPWGGREGRLATNPVSFAVPCNGGPVFLADFSTAETSEGSIRLHCKTGKALSPGTIVDGNGESTTDPERFYGPPRGAILPFGAGKGYRGYALSLLVEILGGLLGGSSTIQDQPGNGLAFLVIDISPFLPPAEFARLMEEMRAYIKSSAPAPGYREVLLPGEPDHTRRAQRMRDGIPVDGALWDQIRAAAGSLGVKWPEGVAAAQGQS